MREPAAIRTARSIITLCFAVCYIANVFLRLPVLTDINLVLMTVVLVLSIFASTGSSRAIGIVLIAISVVVLLYTQAPLDIWKKALQQNADLVVMFILIPLIGIPVQHGGYSESLRGVFARFANSEGRYYTLVSGMAAIIGSLISIAAVPLTHEVSRESPLGTNKKLLGSALTRGFITCMIWAPTSATIALVISLTGIDWVGFAPCAIACALIAEGIGILMVVVAGKKGAGDSGPSHEDDLRSDTAGGEINVSKVIELSVFALLLIVFIAAISQLNGLSAIIVVGMASLVWPCLWMLLIRRLPIYVREFKSGYFEKKLPNTKNQVVLFVGAGMLAQSISYSGIGGVIAQGLLAVTGQSVLLLTIGILIIAILTSMAGVHPIVVVAVIGGAISPEACGITPVYLALVLSMSWALGNAICPASANVIAVSDMVDHSPVEVSIKWNGVYVAIVSVVFVVVMTLFRMAGFL